MRLLSKNMTTHRVLRRPIGFLGILASEMDDDPEEAFWIEIFSDAGATLNLRDPILLHKSCKFNSST